MANIAESRPKEFKQKLILMGTLFEFTVVLEDDQEQRAMDQISLAIAEIRRIEALISSWSDSSQTSEINRQAGLNPVKVNRVLFDLIDRACKVSLLTDGAFDITFASIDKVWHFDQEMNQLPSEEEIERSVARIDYRKIKLNETDTTVFLSEPGMKIGFGGIAKGYAAFRARELLEAKGIENGVINASGDLFAWGRPPDGEKWKVGIANPRKPEKVAAWFSISNTAVVTSGDYESYVEIGGMRYSHIIDPRTGWPAQGIQSVTVICSNPELADALATAIFVMGKDVGLNLVNQLNGIECLIIDDENRFWVSGQLKLNYGRKGEVNYTIGN